MTDNIISAAVSVETIKETGEMAESKTLFDLEDGEDMQETKDDAVAQQDSIVVSSKDSEDGKEPSKWLYDDKIEGRGVPPGWFNHKTFKSVTEQARAYNEARKQITQYSEKLKGFSGAPEKYEEENNEDNVFAIGLKELGQKIGLNQSGYNDLLSVYNKAKELESEKDKISLMQQQKEELKKIGGIGKLKEMETKFIDTFGDGSLDWLKKTIKSHDDYVSLERIVSSVSGRTRVPVSSMESSISSKEQAEELIRDPRWGKDREFTKKADKLLGHMLQNR